MQHMLFYPPVIKHGLPENEPFISDFPIQMVFSIAMFDYQRVMLALLTLLLILLLFPMVIKILSLLLILMLVPMLILKLISLIQTIGSQW